MVLLLTKATTLNEHKSRRHFAAQKPACGSVGERIVWRLCGVVSSSSRYSYRAEGGGGECNNSCGKSSLYLQELLEREVLLDGAKRIAYCGEQIGFSVL